MLFAQGWGQWLKKAKRAADRVLLCNGGIAQAGKEKIWHTAVPLDRR
jgi:hypothetical protein